MFIFSFIFTKTQQFLTLQMRKLRYLVFNWCWWKVAGAEIQTHVCLANTQALNNLERPVSYPVRFIWASFLCQSHNAPTMSLLKTAISGTETSIFQIGRLTLSWGIVRGHVILYHNCGGACCKESREWGSQLENQKRKMWLHLAENSYFLQQTGTSIPFLLTSRSTPIGNQPSSQPSGPCEDPPYTLAKE